MPDHPPSAPDLTAYLHIRSFESDFDKAQGEIRRAASIWVLATFAGYGYSASQITPGGLTSGFLGVLISVLASIGLFTLWIIDQRVYQKLLHSVFVHGLFLEWTDSRFPQLRTKMFADNLNISRQLSLFYVVPMVAFLLASILFGFGPFEFYLQFEQGYEVPGGFLSAIRWTSVLCIVALTGIMVWKSVSGRNLLDTHGAPYPREFNDYIRDEQYQNCLRKRFSCSPNSTTNDPSRDLE